MTSTTAQANVHIDARDLVAPDVFSRLANSVARTNGLTDDLGERIMEQAIAYLYACTTTNAKLTPSPMVDLGWHTFILHTEEYASFCEGLTDGGFIHHVPDPPGTISHAEALERLGATIATIRAAGLTVDVDLWILPATCSQGPCDSPTPNGARR